VTVHGDLADLVSPPDIWEEQPSVVSESVLLDRALLLLAASHADSEPDRVGCI
jgi:hypothetical protein